MALIEKQAAIIGFFIGVFVGMLIYRLMLYLEKLDWIHTRIYHSGFINGYKAGYKDGKIGRVFDPYRRRK